MTPRERGPLVSEREGGFWGVRSVEHKFWLRVKIGPGCWEWTGSRNAKGYGKTYIPGEPSLSHAQRAAWWLVYGVNPDQRHVLHHCDNPGCVRPSHLFLGTNHDNIRDRDAKGRNGHSKKTHCKHGHEYTPENIYPAGKDGRGRDCRRCRYLRKRARQLMGLGKRS